MERRFAFVSAVMLLAFAGIALRLYYLQVVRGEEFAKLAERNRIRTILIRPARGLVYDRHHRLLVDTVPSFDAVIVPEDTPNLTTSITRLEHLLGVSNLAEKLSENSETRPPFEPVPVVERLTWEQVARLESHQLDLPGVSIEVNPRRHYIYGPLAAHLIGYVGEVNQKELRASRLYHAGDEIGRSGLERSWDRELRGVVGGREIEVNAVGRRLRELRQIPGQRGKGLVLTIDLDLQQAAEQALGDRAGAIVALDPNNGELLAMVSHPTFDPNEFASGIAPERWKAITHDPSHPLQNRAIQGVYPPGSTFKVLEAVGGLQTHILSPSTSYFCSGGMWYGDREYRCWRKQGHGNIALRAAIAQSCDVYFYQVGLKLGIDRIARWSYAFGLGQPTGIRLPGERSGIVPSSEWKKKQLGERWYPAETLSVAIGQGFLGVTPIQLAVAESVIANGGIRYRPHYVLRVESPSGTVEKVPPPEVVARLKLEPEVLATVRTAMKDVVNGLHGTGSRARLDGIQVCGKTGTAQVVKQAQGVRVKEEELPERFRAHAWFMAFAPCDSPQIAVVSIVEHAGHGGSAAAPIVHDVMEKYFELYPPRSGGPLQAQSTGRAIKSDAAVAATTSDRPPVP